MDVCQFFALKSPVVTPWDGFDSAAPHFSLLDAQYRELIFLEILDDMCQPRFTRQATDIPASKAQYCHGEQEQHEGS